MKVLTLLTSTNRNGIAKDVIDAITRGIEDNGGSNEILYYDDYEIKHCTACRVCQRGGGCVIDDDFNIIIDKIRDADYFIFTSEIFYNALSGHSKIFLDRFLSLGGDPDLEMHGKKAMVLLTHYTTGTFPELNKNLVRIFTTPNFKLNKILDVGGLLSRKFTTEDYDEFEDIGYELENFEPLKHELDEDTTFI